MKYDSDHWRDKRYLAIREELEQAGYSCVRADELKSSGPVVDEVCRLLREAALVVIDSSGDSHNVSYEIGYCHGINRSPHTTLLLRAGADFPFNYRHFRHRVYRDLRHLRRLVRDYLQIHEPLSDGQFGYTFTFGFAAGGVDYIRDGAFCIFDALRDQKFSGRCECYSAEQFGFGRLFSVAIMLRCPGRKATPNYNWWMKLQNSVEENALRHKGSITFQPTLSEVAGKEAMLAKLVPSGVAEFLNGSVVRLLGSENDSLLHSYHERLENLALSAEAPLSVKDAAPIKGEFDREAAKQPFRITPVPGQNSSGMNRTAANKFKPRN